MTKEKSRKEKRGMLIAAGILTIIGYVFLVATIGLGIYWYKTYESQELDEIVFASIISATWVVSVACLITSFSLNISYRSKNKKAGIKPGALSMFVLVMTIIGAICVAVPLILPLIGAGLYALFHLMSAGFVKIAGKFSSSGPNKVKVKDERGNEHELTQSSSESKRYKDEKGEWWTSSDGEKFTKE